MAVRVKRVTDPLDDRVKDRIIGYGSSSSSGSGSEHSGTSNISNDDSESFHSLSYLLHCFNEENDNNDAINDDELDESHTQDNDSKLDSDSEHDQAKLEELNSTLRNLNVDSFRNILFSNVLKAIDVFRSIKPKPNTQILNRNVMLFLQKLGYNAAICKTKWLSSGGLTAGNYEFIDVVQSGTGVRYFIDVNFAGEFQIARQTNQFRRLLQTSPELFVGKSVELKVIIKLMSDEIRRSMKSRGLVLPPWRKNRFMQNKWFGPYRRTVNYTPVRFVASLTVPGNQVAVGVKCSLIGFSVVDSAPLINAATRTR